MAVAWKAFNFAVMENVKKVLPAFAVSVFCCGYAGASDIVIRNQKEFAYLQSSLSEAVSSGEKKVNVTICEGTYYYNDKHVCISGWNNPRTSVTIQGQGRCVLVAKGKTRSNGDKYADSFNKQTTYFDNGLNEVSIWSDTFQAADTVRVLSQADKLCMLPYKGLTPVEGDGCGKSYVQITRWYTSAMYKVESITPEGILFKCDDLAYSGYLKAFNINGDYGFYHNVGSKGKAFPRFRLCNVKGVSPMYITDKVVSSVGPLYECRVSTFLSVEDSRLGSLAVSGVTFKGNAYGWNRAVLMLKNAKLEKGVSVKDNVFCNLKTEALRLWETDNVAFSGNRSEDCSSGIVRSENDCVGTLVEGNLFQKCGTGLYNTFLVYCVGTDFRVSGNRFVDFGYCAVRTGVWWAYEMEHPCRGVIEGNEMSYSKEYMQNRHRHTLMDSGAIYVGTQTSGVVIQGNNVHDYAGIHQNRGIFLDDGTCNCTVRDNVVKNIPNSYCIDLRTVSYKGNPKNKSKSFNVGNVLGDNDCDGEVRFETN